ncbi:MAG: hypothetical protein ABL973_13545 [Micropepsaceae bacterium]
MTILPPKGTNTGVVMIVFPGGGFKAVVINSEGTEICNWISSKGMTCIPTKYHVPTEMGQTPIYLSERDWLDVCFVVRTGWVRKGSGSFLRGAILLSTNFS